MQPRILTAILLTLFSGSCLAAEPPKFFETVQEYFEAWDLNHDGWLSDTEINLGVENHEYKGKPAAALAVLSEMERYYIRKDKQPKFFSRQTLDELRQSVNPEHNKYKKSFDSCLQKLKVSNRQLFSNSLPSLDKIKQGPASDCYFLAPLGSLINSRPEFLTRMISEMPDGNFIVQFFGVPPITVSRPTDAEICAYNSDGDDGLWLPVLVKAYGTLKLNEEGFTLEEDPLDPVVLHGGKVAPVMKLLTGHSVISRRPAKIATTIREDLAMALAERRLVAVGVPGHMLAAINFDRSTDTLTIWNPWGSTRNYLGIKMQNGFFQIPVDEFLQKFNQLSIENKH